MLVTCPECELKISERAKTCPGCGLPDTSRLSKECYEQEVKACDGKEIETSSAEFKCVKNQYSKPRIKVRIKADIEKLDIGYCVIFLFPCQTCGKRVELPKHATALYKFVY